MRQQFRHGMEIDILTGHELREELAHREQEHQRSEAARLPQPIRFYGGFTWVAANGLIRVDPPGPPSNCQWRVVVVRFNLADAVGSAAGPVLNWYIGPPPNTPDPLVADVGALWQDVLTMPQSKDYSEKGRVVLPNETVYGIVSGGAGGAQYVFTGIAMQEPLPEFGPVTWGLQ